MGWKQGLSCPLHVSLRMEVGNTGLVAVAADQAALGGGKTEQNMTSTPEMKAYWSSIKSWQREKGDRPQHRALQMPEPSFCGLQAPAQTFFYFTTHPTGRQTGEPGASCEAAESERRSNT